MGNMELNLRKKKILLVLLALLPAAGMATCVYLHVLTFGDYAVRVSDPGSYFMIVAMFGGFAAVYLAGQMMGNKPPVPGRVARVIFTILVLYSIGGFATSLYLRGNDSVYDEPDGRFLRYDYKTKALVGEISREEYDRFNRLEVRSLTSGLLFFYLMEMGMIYHGLRLGKEQ